jgi:hypothetical protein
VYSRYAQVLVKPCACVVVLVVSASYVLYVWTMDVYLYVSIMY